MTAELPVDRLREIVEAARWVTHSAECDRENETCTGEDDCPGATVHYATGDEAMERLAFLEEWQAAAQVAAWLGREVARYRAQYGNLPGPSEVIPF